MSDHLEQDNRERLARTRSPQPRARCKLVFVICDPTDSTRYLRYHPGVKVTQPYEADDIAAVREIFAELRAYAFEKHRHGLRDAHAKSHGVLRGTLRVVDDLPGELRQGLFAQPCELPVIVRFSTAPGDIVPDGVAAARGMAIKVLDVDG